VAPTIEQSWGSIYHASLPGPTEGAAIRRARRFGFVTLDHLMDTPARLFPDSALNLLAPRSRPELLLLDEPLSGLSPKKAI
jgi:ABC-type branched-subunit amino acid transport system ATPase component